MDTSPGTVHMKWVLNVSVNLRALTHTCPSFTLTSSGGLFRSFDINIMGVLYKLMNFALVWWIFAGISRIVEVPCLCHPPTLVLCELGEGFSLYLPLFFFSFCCQLGDGLSLYNPFSCFNVWCLGYCVSFWFGSLVGY